MSIDNIQLPYGLLQILYSKTLYDLSIDKSDLNNIQSKKLSFLGSNQKKIVILVTADEAIYLPDAELNFLLGILTACKLSMADIALINIFNNPGLNYSTITEELKAERIFLFGLSAEALELPLQFPYYQIQHFNDQVYLSSASLNELQKDKGEKLKLWNCLKNIFLI